jgi:hypothetical protein
MLHIQAFLSARRMYLAKYLLQQNNAVKDVEKC